MVKIDIDEVLIRFKLLYEDIDKYGLIYVRKSKVKKLFEEYYKDLQILRDNNWRLK